MEHDDRAGGARGGQENHPRHEGHDHATDRHVVAHFPSPEQAREAMIALEQSGVEAHDVNLVEGHVTTSKVRSTWAQDRRVFAEGGRRYVGTGLLGAALGAAVAVAVVLVLGIGPAPGAALAAGVGGGLFGFWAAAYYGVATRLPVNEEVFDTFGPGERSAAASVEVRIHDDGDIDQVTEVVRDHGAEDVQHVG